MSMTATPPKPRWKSASLWIVKGLLVLAFVSAGLAKLTSVPMLVDNFERIGVGQWFRYVTGALEIVGALLLVLPRRAAFGASLLVCIMIGAIIAHIFVIGGTFAPALFLLVLAAIVAFAQRDQIADVFEGR